MAANAIGPIDMVVVNLYPFEAVTARAETTFAEAIENIDIGGPSMVRSSAKNHAYVTVLVDPDDYAGGHRRARSVGRGVGGDQPQARGEGVRARPPATTARSPTISPPPAPRRPFGPSARLVGTKLQDLRYGENPHQRAAFYRDATPLAEPSVAGARQLQGKELSFNNIVDANAALELVKEFRAPTAVAIKHTNPCGVATAPALVDAFTKARASDPVSIFGGIVGLQSHARPRDRRGDAGPLPRGGDRALHCSRRRRALRRLEALAAGALADARPRPGEELFEVSRAAWRGAAARSLDMKRVVGGFLVQDRDLAEIDVAACTVATKRAPSADELAALDFAWRICKHVKSNAIVLARADQVIGVGAGQMSRVDSARLAVTRAESAGLTTHGTVAASDAFFPFRDGLDVIAKAGARAVIQPGGSIRDAEVIAAADEHGMAMVLTGQRHFRH